MLSICIKITIKKDELFCEKISRPKKVEFVLLEIIEWSEMKKKTPTFLKNVELNLKILGHKDINVSQSDMSSDSCGIWNVFIVISQIC